MQNEREFIDDMVERYVYQASRHMPRAGREDAVKELRALIYDMLSERAQGLPPTKKQLEAVFVELGRPEEFGANYKNENARVLIGKALFPVYFKIIKIVAAAVPFGLGVAMLIQALLGEIEWYMVVLQWLGGSFSALFTAFGIVTFIFAVFEYKGVKTEEFNTSAGPFDLPPVPLAPKEFESGEGIGSLTASIVFTALFSLLFAFAPGIFSIYTLHGGFVPLFNAERVHELLPLLLLLLVLGVGKEVYRYLDRRHGGRSFAILTVFGVATLATTLLVFGDASVWNPGFLSAAAGGYGLSDPFFGALWRNVIHYFPLLFVFTFVLETATNAGKAFARRTA